MKLLRLQIYGIGIGLVLMLAALGLGRLLPAGELYAYTLPWRSQPAVYLMDIDRALSVPITKSLPRADAYRLAAIAPDERQIAVTLMAEGDSDLYLLDIWNGVLNPLLTEPDYDDQAAWSPDSGQLAYSSLWEANWDIYTVRLADGVRTRLTNSRDGATQPAWSPDGSYIAFVENQMLYVMEADCAEVGDALCGDLAQPITSSSGSDSFPTWSPDGTQLIFMSTRSGRAEIYLMHMGCLESGDGCIGQNPRPLTDGLGRLQTLSWSAKWGILLFISNQYGKAGLYRLQPDCDLTPEGCVLEPLALVVF